jgi:hypothetical protein
VIGFVVMEAIHSTALEHHSGCGCDVCKAADGDEAALARVWVQVRDGLEERKRENEAEL